MVEATDELRRQIAEVIADYHGRMIQAHTLFRSYELAGELLPLVAAVVAEARTEGIIMAQSAIEFIQERDSGLAIDLDEHLAQKLGAPDRELLDRAAALRGVGNQKVGVTVDDLALDEMDGNQNAEPRWSANRLEEVLRDGLPDQNAEPETAPVEWGIAWSADHIDTASSWGADEAGARHRVSKYRDYVLVKRLYGQGDDSWVRADQKGTEQ